MPKVLLIMTDGLRPDAFLEAKVPTFRQLMEEGAHTLEGRSVWPSITLPCHMSLFHSVPPMRHNTLVNTYMPMVRPVPGLFEVLKGAGLRTAMYFSWEPLRDVSRPLSISTSLFHAYAEDPHISDDRLLETALPHLRKGDHDFEFLYFGAIDEVGHLSGWMSAEYLAQVEHTDALLKQVLEAIPAGTTVIVQSDHGGHGRMHGTKNKEDMTIPWMAWGQGVRGGHSITQKVSLLETAPTVAHLLDVQVPKAWEGKAVLEAFEKQ